MPVLGFFALGPIVLIALVSLASCTEAFAALVGHQHF
jgi:hypothetical protein